MTQRSQPGPRPENPYADRLRQVRVKMGLDIKTFHGRLVEEAGVTVSYAAARRYDYDRVAPPEFFVAVSRVFDFRLEWLLTGDGAATPEEEALRRSTEDAELAEVERLWDEQIPGGLAQGFPPYSTLSSWGRDAAYALLFRYGSKGFGFLHEEIAVRVGQALHAPLEILQIDPPGELEQTDWYDEYVSRMCSALIGLMAQPRPKEDQRYPAEWIRWEPEFLEAPSDSAGD